MGKTRILTVLFAALLVPAAQPAEAMENPAAANGEQVRRAVEEHNKWTDEPLACYIVPAISPVKRLPDTLPPDGQLGDTLNVIAARDSYEPASFVMYPFSDLENVEIHASDLRSETGDILPGENVDIKLVKSWFRGGTAWHSFFADPDRRTLVPELLLNDQDLIQVDTDREENYLRIDYPNGPQYRWVSYPAEIRGNLDVFNHVKEPVRDADHLLPFRLQEGLTQQMWITVHVPEETEGGLYTGEITLAADGGFSAHMTLQLRVLPFVLPEPKTYHTLDDDFYTIIYNSTYFGFYRELAGKDQDTIEKHLLAQLTNMRKHNILSPLVRFADPEEGRRQFQLMREAGMNLDAIFSRSSVINWLDIFRYGNHGNEVPPARLEYLAEKVASERRLMEDELGHSNMYAIGWDEPGRQTLRSQQPLIRLLHDEGLRYYTTAKDWHLEVMGFNQDAVNLSGKVRRDRARPWHALGARVFTYSYPHTGPENPDFIRRSHGMRLYKKDYDGTANYRYQGYRQNNWNDFTNMRYRIRFTYPTQNGVIDTLHWAGLREAIDDIRYATKLRQVALQAIESGDTESRYAGRKALRYLELLDERHDDLNAARLEIINFILEIQKTGGLQ